MTSDTLEAALRAVPLRCATCKATVPYLTIHVCDRPLLMADYPALAAAVRAFLAKEE